MGDNRTDPSMEDILASIRRIIADEGDAPIPSPAGEADEVLELTNPIPPGVGTPEIVSTDAAEAARDKLAALSSMVVKGAGADNTLEALVREMLRPMLKEWLDQKLPILVEHLVEKEIARITGRTL